MTDDNPEKWELYSKRQKEALLLALIPSGICFLAPFSGDLDSAAFLIMAALAVAIVLSFYSAFRTNQVGDNSVGAYIGWLVGYIVIHSAALIALAGGGCALVGNFI